MLVPIVTLASLFDEHEPTVLKADIEGTEYELDWSALPASLRALAIELHFSPKRAWRGMAYGIVAAIEAQGFHQVKPFIDTGKNWHCVPVWERGDG